MGSQPDHGAQARSLGREIEWFNQVLMRRFNDYFQQEPRDEIRPPVAPDLCDDPSPYARQVRYFDLNAHERLILILALIPHLCPQALDNFLIRNKSLDRPYCEFGGWQGKHHGGFLPTLETAVFLLAGDDLEKRLSAQALFEPGHIFARENILRLEPSASEPFFSCPLELSTEAFELFTTGEHQPPTYSIRFPAQHLTTQLAWEDLVLPSSTMAELEEMFTWIQHRQTILEGWGLGRYLQPGYRTLFHGPPGTGKTLAAALIGKRAGMEVYRIDLASIISKYIGETEKNLSALFERGRAKDWILFFDEADALFSKRTHVTTANDRHGNQEIAYLLQSIESYPGAVILATNLKANIDEAFARRFQGQILFPAPDAEQRLRLWTNSLKGVPQDTLNLEHLAHTYEVSGSEITNVLRKAALAVLNQGGKALTQEHLVQALATLGKQAPRSIGGVVGSITRSEPRRAWAAPNSEHQP